METFINNHRSSSDRFSAFMVRHRLFVLLFVLLGTAICFFGATRIKTEVILQDLFPYDHPYLKLHARFSQVFGGGGIWRGHCRKCERWGYF